MHLQHPTQGSVKAHIASGSTGQDGCRLEAIHQLRHDCAPFHKGSGQRQAEIDRRQAQATVSTAGAAEPAPCDNSAVLDRLTEQITERLQMEVRRENARLMQEGADAGFVKWDVGMWEGWARDEW